MLPALQELYQAAGNKASSKAALARTVAALLRRPTKEVNAAALDQITAWSAYAKELRYIEKEENQRPLSLTARGRKIFFGDAPKVQGDAGSAMPPKDGLLDAGEEDRAELVRADKAFKLALTNAGDELTRIKSVLAALETRLEAALSAQLTDAAQQAYVSTPAVQAALQLTGETQPSADLLDALISIAPAAADDAATAAVAAARISKLVHACAATKRLLQTLQTKHEEAKPARAAKIALERLDAALQRAADAACAGTPEQLKELKDFGIKNIGLLEGWHFQIGVLNIAAAYPYDGGSDETIRKSKLKRACNEAVACKLDLLVVLELRADATSEALFKPAGWDCIVAASSGKEAVAFFWNTATLKPSVVVRDRQQAQPQAVAVGRGQWVRRLLLPCTKPISIS